MGTQPESFLPDGNGVATAQPDGAPPDFDTALARLEALVARMERGDLSLEQSLQAYGQGVALVGTCQKSLDAAEQQVRVLQDGLLRAMRDDANEQED